MTDPEKKEEEEAGPSPDILALIDTLKSEGKLYRREERREDRGKVCREWTTNVLLACTLVAVGWQVHEMIKVYEPITKQAEATKEAAVATVRQSENSEKALTQAQRAWVGPWAAQFESPPIIGKPLVAKLSYQNMGREPALAFVKQMDIFSASDDEKGNRAAEMAVKDDDEKCKQEKAWSGGVVVFPLQGTQYSDVMTAERANFVDEAVTNGKKKIFVQGCFLYRTLFGGPHYTHFCFFYQQGQTQPGSLNLCEYGQDAD